MCEIMVAARRQLRAGEEYSIRSVATEIGLSSQGLYRYVDSYDHLREMVADQVLEDVLEFMSAARDRYEHPVSRVIAASVAFRTWTLANLPEFRHTFNSLSSNSLVRVREFFTPLFEDLRASGAVTEETPDWELEYVWTQVFGNVALAAFQQIDKKNLESDLFFLTTLREIGTRLKLQSPEGLDAIFAAESKR